MISPINTAVAGLQTSSARLERAAQVLTNPGSGDEVKAAADTIIAKQEFQANLNVIKTTDKMTQNLLDIIA